MDQDFMQHTIDKVLTAQLPHEAKMRALVDLECDIERLYEQGLTKVKPVSLMTAEDFVN